MAYDIPPAGSLKRKRRRREDKPAISARIYLDSSLKGEVGILSGDLIQDLHPAHATDQDVRVFAAVTPWTPHPSVTESQWTILPFRRSAKNEKQLPPSTIRFPANALGTQSFVNVVQSVSPNRTLRQNAAVEIRISDVVPLALDTIFVSIDTEAIARLEEMQKKYGGGFSSNDGAAQKRASRRGGAENMPLSVEDSRRQLVDDALEQAAVIHSGDMLPLDVTHPVTHSQVPPCKVLGCEPVSQGLLVPSTKIVITSSGRQASFGASNLLLPVSPRLPEESEEEEDSMNETFHSATEENAPVKPVVISKSATDMSNSEDMFDSSANEDDLSDDSDDMISLTKPGLMEQLSGFNSALTIGTPRPFGYGLRTGGIATPGSVYSKMTASTMRGGHGGRSKIFLAQGLLEHIPDDVLHPKPAREDDEEARVFVNSAALARLGCFSGDWVKIEASENSMLPGLSAFGIDSFQAENWRPVKVYSLPESLSKRQPRYQVNPRHGRRDSISSLNANAATPTLYASPILLSNLKDPEHVSLAPLSTAKRQSLKRGTMPRPATVSRLPPTASEVTLRKIVTPLSNERALSNVLFSNLKEYFEKKHRIVKAGDLVAIPIDESLGRSLYDGGTDQDEAATSALLNQLTSDSNSGAASADRGVVNVAWFTIEAVNTPPEDHDPDDGIEGWNGAASIDPGKMTMRQSGDDRRKLPSAISSTWPYYLGARKPQAKAPQASNGPAGLPDKPQLYTSPLQRRLRELISVSISPRAIHLGLPPLAVLITSTQRSIGKSSTVARVCADLGIHYFPIDAHDISAEGGAGVDVQSQGLLEARCERALDCGYDCTAICIKHIEALNSDRVATSLKGVLQDCRVLVATTTDVDKLPDSVRGLFTHELEMVAPDEGEREGLLRDFVLESGVALGAEVDLASVAVKTAALVAGDLADVVDRAIIARKERLDALSKSTTAIAGQPVTLKDIQLSGGAAATCLIAPDFDSAVDFARKNFADSIGAPKIPNVQWSDVGGLQNVKDAVIETVQLPLSRPELFAKGLKKRSGILFYGPPGTGKTLLAKAIATEFSLNFFSVKGPELLNMYIGESEANVRRVFQRARDARPCVVFFDELDSVAPKRGNQGDSGGVMDRIVSQLLAELDGMSDGEEGGGGVFVIGATNRPDLLDQALLRPGRFDKMLYLGISDTHAKQATILEALTRKFTLDADLSLTRVASTLPFTFTGADLYALCSDAMLKAITRSAQIVDSRLAAINADRTSRGLSKASVAYYFGHHATEDDLQVSVSEQDFMQAKSELVPSVSVDELGHYERVRQTFEGSNIGGEKKQDESTSGSEPTSRPQTRDSDRNAQMLKRAMAAANKDRALTNGHTAPSSRARGSSNATRRDTEDNDDDYVIRTDKMTLNGGSGHNSRPPSSKGKGKGKGKDARALPDEGEDLYD